VLLKAERSDNFAPNNNKFI